MNRAQVISIKFLIKGDVSYVVYCNIAQGLHTHTFGNEK